MRAAVMALAMLIGAVSAAPAAAQGIRGLEWLTGRWCAPGADQGIVCLTFAAQDGESMTAEWATQSKGAKAPVKSEAVFTVEDGRVVLRSDDQGSVYREVSRGPGMLAMGNESPGEFVDGDLKQTRYHREGDELVLDFTYVGGRTATDRYKRED
jgi:hypothetical protein